MNLPLYKHALRRENGIEIKQRWSDYTGIGMDVLMTIDQKKLEKLGEPLLGGYHLQ